MKKIAIMIRWFTYNDAVSNDVLGMYNTLKEYGYKVNIFCDNRHWKTYFNINNFFIKNISKIKKFISSSEDVIIYHYTSGWLNGINILKNLSCKKIIRYHGITPAFLFKSISDSHYQRSIEGYKQIKEINSLNINAIFTNSISSLKELNTIIKLKKNITISVIPPFHIIDKLIKPDYNFFNFFNFFKKEKNYNLLSVGRIAPHKGQINLVNSFKDFNKYYPSSKLYIVGKKNNEFYSYNKKLEESISNIKNKIIIMNNISNHKLNKIYLKTDFFIIASKHEGFCIPLIEAMAYKIPIIGNKNGGAILETGKGAIIPWNINKKFDLLKILENMINDSNVLNNYKEKSWNLYCNKYKINIIKKIFIEKFILI